MSADRAWGPGRQQTHTHTSWALIRLDSFVSVTSLNRKDVKQSRLRRVEISLETSAVYNPAEQVTAAQRWAGPSDRRKPHLELICSAAPRLCSTRRLWKWPFSQLDPIKVEVLWCAECVSALSAYTGFRCVSKFLCVPFRLTLRDFHIVQWRPPTSPLNTSRPTCFPFWF